MVWKEAPARAAAQRTEARLRRRSVFFKRLFDVSLACLLLALCTPLSIVVAVLIKLTSSGPVLFRQERIGRHGRPFVMYKLRTMAHGADPSVHEAYFQQYVKGVPAPGEDGVIYKMRRDFRITPVGRVLRRLALDEIPQLINVVKGEMSLVGPRPPLEYEVQLYSAHDFQRLEVMPGMTGMWQIKGRDSVDFSTMVELDLEYIRRQSLLLDLGIVLATVPALVWNCVKN
jgi:lipopolysaccharide/colanic/teichoic acid biosynthesis glycosyltransferase